MLVDEFPMTVTGKIRKVQMREESAAKLGLVGTGHSPVGRFLTRSPTPPTPTRASIRVWRASRSGSPRVAAAFSRTAYLLTGDIHLAEDLVQETLARVAQKWRRLDRLDAHDAYARTVHAPPRDRPLAQAQGAAAGGAHGPSTPSSRRGPRRRTPARPARRPRPATPKQRAVLSLRFYDDLTEAQTAHALGCSVNTVKSRFRAAPERLRTLAPDLLAFLTQDKRRHDHTPARTPRRPAHRGAVARRCRCQRRRRRVLDAGPGTGSASSRPPRSSVALLAGAAAWLPTTAPSPPRRRTRRAPEIAATRRRIDYPYWSRDLHCPGPAGRNRPTGQTTGPGSVTAVGLWDVTRGRGRLPAGALAGRRTPRLRQRPPPGGATR